MPKKEDEAVMAASFLYIKCKVLVEEVAGYYTMKKALLKCSAGQLHGFQFVWLS